MNRLSFDPLKVATDITEKEVEARQRRRQIMKWHSRTPFIAFTSASRKVRDKKIFEIIYNEFRKFMIKSFKLPRDAFYYSIIDMFSPSAPTQVCAIEKLLIAKAICYT